LLWKYSPDFDAGFLNEISIIINEFNFQLEYNEKRNKTNTFE